MGIEIGGYSPRSLQLHSLTLPGYLCYIWFGDVLKTLSSQSSSLETLWSRSSETTEMRLSVISCSSTVRMILSQRQNVLAALFANGTARPR